MRTEAGVIEGVIRLRDVGRLAWPIAVSMLSHTAMGLVDTLFVGRLGTESLAAVGLAVTVVWLAQAFGLGLIGGVKIVVSHRTGAGDEEAVSSLFWQGIWVALAIGSVTAVSVWAWEPLLLGLSGDPSVGGLACAYFAVRVLGAPLFFLQLVLSMWFQGRGDTRTPMVASLACNITNIVLDPLLIFGWGSLPAMGVRGAALATVIGFVPSLVWLLWCAHGLGVTRVVRPHRGLLMRVWELGLPKAAGRALEIGSYVLLSAMLARVSAIDLAAHVIAVRIMSVSFMPGFAMGEAAAVLVGQALGAGRPDLARDAWRAGCQLSLGIMSLWAVVAWGMPDVLVAWFGAEADVAEVAVVLLGIGAFFQAIDAVAMTSMSVLNGAGDTRFVMVASVASTWFVKLPAAWWLAVVMGWGAVGAWGGLTLEIVVLALVTVGRMRGEAWIRSVVAVA